MAKDTKKTFSKVLKVLKDDPDIRVGFSELDLWATTGIPALNHKLSGDYKKAFLYGSLVNVYGESQSGKSLLAATVAAQEQRERGAFVLWVDVEGAESDKTEGTKWFEQAGVNVDEDHFQRLWVPTYRKALKTMTQFVNMYRDDEKNELPPLIVVFDSYSQLMTDSMIEQNTGKKELSGDQGQNAKQLADLVKRMKGMLEGLPIIVFGIMHVYMSQEQYGSKFELTGGMKPMYIAHSTLLMNKYNLTNEKASPHLRMKNETADDKRVVIGTRTVLEIRKRRAMVLTHKPFETIDLEIVYPEGIDKYSGLWEMFLEKDILVSPSNSWYEFTRSDGTKKKFQRKDFLKYVDELMTAPVPEWRKPAGEDDAPEVDEEAIIAELENRNG